MKKKIQSDCPTGAGSVLNNLRDAYLSRARRASKMNNSEATRTMYYNKILSSHRRNEEKRWDKMLERMRRTHDELEAYTAVVGEFRVDKFLTFRTDVKRKRCETDWERYRYRKERKIFSEGFGLRVFKKEIKQELYDREPERKGEVQRRQLLLEAKQDLDNVMDRTIQRIAQLSVISADPNNNQQSLSDRKDTSVQIAPTGIADDVIGQSNRRLKVPVVVASKSYFARATLPPINENI